MPDEPVARMLAQGNGWTASDIVCRSGPHTRPFEERHTAPAVAVVVAGTFQYRSGAGDELMIPGSLLLGSPGQCFECAHEHGTGDRCLSIAYSPEFLDRLAAEAAGARQGRFQALRVPPVREVSGLAALASAALAGSSSVAWEEYAVKLAAKAVQLDRGRPPKRGVQPGATARVTAAVRRIEAHPEESHDLGHLARAARLSPYHFLRTFESLTGATPHQYVLRIRLRKAADRLSRESALVLDIALDSGFGDVSNFNRSFRAEFGVSPRAWRMRSRS